MTNVVTERIYKNPSAAYDPARPERWSAVPPFPDD